MFPPCVSSCVADGPTIRIHSQIQAAAGGDSAAACNPYSDWPPRDNSAPLESTLYCIPFSWSTVEKIGDHCPAECLQRPVRQRSTCFKDPGNWSADRRPSETMGQWAALFQLAQRKPLSELHGLTLMAPPNRPLLLLEYDEQGRGVWRI